MSTAPEQLSGRPRTLGAVVRSARERQSATTRHTQASNVPTIAGSGAGGGAGGGIGVINPGETLVCQTSATGEHGTYTLLGGDVDGVNAVFTVPGGYVSGTLEVNSRGQDRYQSTTEPYDSLGWFELDPAAGTFQFRTPPKATDKIKTRSRRPN